MVLVSSFFVCVQYVARRKKVSVKFMSILATTFFAQISVLIGREISDTLKTNIRYPRLSL